jgi:mono/diheme cytochrome c family protein
MGRRTTRTTAVYILLAAVVMVTVAILAGRVMGPALKMAQNGASDPGRAALGQLGCLSCHALAGQGGNLGPALGSELAKRGQPWIYDYVTSGAHIDVYPGNGHEAFAQLNDEQATLLSAYLAALSVTSRYKGPVGRP